MGKKVIKSTLSPIKTIEIEIALAKYFDVRKNIIVPNISFGLSGMHECDMFVISKAGFVTEVEIKISKADFMKDFEKGHNHKDRQNRIKYFYYAMPIDLYDKVKDLIPEHAGILTCERLKNYLRIEFVKVIEVRKPQMIAKARKLTDEEQFKVTKLGCMRIFSLKSKNIKLINDNKVLTEKLKIYNGNTKI